MQQRDKYQRSAPTAPLDPAQSGMARAVRPTSDVRNELEALLAQSAPTLAKLEERAELLWRACQDGGVAVPGVEGFECRHALSFKGEQILSYLLGALKTNPALIQPVQMTVYRFDQARAAAEKCQAAMEGPLAPMMVEDLKRKLFYLARCYVDFKDDPVLSQLFPGPKGPVAGPSGAGTRPLSEVELMKQRMARESLLMKVETFSNDLKPRLEVLRQTAEMVAGKKLSVAELMTPDGRKARVASLRLLGTPDSQARLRGMLEASDRLGAALKEAQRGQGDLGALRQAVVIASQQALACRQDPLLADLLPLQESSLFPDAAALDA